MMNETNDEQAAPPSSSRVLTSEGKKEAQAYAVAELHDSTRPTVEMERVQYTDPRKQITVKTARPAVPPLPPIGAPRVPDFDDELGVRPTLLRDDGSDRPTIERPTLLREEAGDHPTIPLVGKAQRAQPAPRRTGLWLGAAVAAIALAGAALLLAPRRAAHESAPPAATTQPTTTIIAPAPVDTTPAPAAPAETAAPTATAAPADRAPAPPARPRATRPAAAKPSAATRAAPAPAPAQTTPPPAKGRLFGVEN